MWDFFFSFLNFGVKKTEIGLSGALKNYISLSNSPWNYRSAYSPKLRLLRMAAAKYNYDQRIDINQRQNENRGVLFSFPNPVPQHSHTWVKAARTDSHNRGLSWCKNLLRCYHSSEPLCGRRLHNPRVRNQHRHRETAEYFQQAVFFSSTELSFAYFDA